LFIHFLVEEPILLKLDFDLDLDVDFDQLGNLNIDDPLVEPLVDPPVFGFVVEAPKKELDRVSDSGGDFDEDPNGHHEEDLDSCARTKFDEKKTKTKPSTVFRCAFMASLPY